MTGINREEGGGPWTHLNTDPLAPSESFLYDYETAEKGRLRPWAPMDNIQVKNWDSSNRVHVLINGKFDLYVDPNGVETFSRTGVVRWRITNEGTGTIDQGDLTVSASVEAYSADDRALERKKRGLVSGFIMDKLGQ